MFMSEVCLIMSLYLNIILVASLSNARSYATAYFCFICQIDITISQEIIKIDGAFCCISLSGIENSGGHCTMENSIQNFLYLL